MFLLPARLAGRNEYGGLYTWSAVSGFGSSQELLCRFVLNTHTIFQATWHFTPRFAQYHAAENWQIQSSSTKASGGEFSSLLKHRCLLLSQYTRGREKSINDSFLSYKNIAENVTVETMLSCFA